MLTFLSIECCSNYMANLLMVSLCLSFKPVTRQAGE